MVFFVAVSTLDLNSSSNSFCSAVLLVRRPFFDFITASKSALAIDSACALNSSCNASLISLVPVAFLGEGFRLGGKVPATKWVSKDSIDDLICEMLCSTVTALLTMTLISEAKINYAVFFIFEVLSFLFSSFVLLSIYSLLARKLCFYL